MKPSVPSAKRIAKEVLALERILPKVKQYSIFGDDHHAAIRAQIAVLQNVWNDEDYICGEYGEHVETSNGQHRLDSALDAMNWRGEFEGSLAASWKELT